MWLFLVFWQEYHQKKNSYNTLILKELSVFCCLLAFLLVIQLGFEPRTPTLKVLCSTGWATESSFLSERGCKDREEIGVCKFFMAFFLKKYYSSIILKESIFSKRSISFGSSFRRIANNISQDNSKLRSRTSGFSSLITFMTSFRTR